LRQVKQEEEEEEEVEEEEEEEEECSVCLNFIEIDDADNPRLPTFAVWASLS